MSKETVYMDAVSKLNDKDVVVGELAILLAKVCYALRPNIYMLNEYEIYEEAMAYLKRLAEAEL